MSCSSRRRPRSVAPSRVPDSWSSAKASFAQSWSSWPALRASPSRCISQVSATDVYVKPGVVEGFIGITVLEALGLGKPVVAFETEDVKLALTDGETGLIARNGDVASLAERIVYLLRNPSVGNRLGQAGQQVVLQRFDFGVLAGRLEEFYQGVLERPTALTT